ncbi:Cys-tRNA(Pro) deacylase [Microbulbifer taiwanensis]|uniref:Cys-tRNA(Pro)/Cys-tRNA(Cys) deacylase n=1 Tax=Microbulbifer taiwanensis TaxID=986746 RepID=A0ABW1YI53_9GAMM|nr:Cys-tRNA(Pro) deacylase [Microbulbifer taiwanensis]
MTPGIAVAKRAKIAHRIHEYSHDSSSESYGLEAVEKLGAEKTRVFKTLVVCLDGKELAVGVVPVSSMLSMKLVARAGGAKKATMADKPDVERSTGYLLGGVSPLGQKKRLRTFIDTSAKNHTTIFVSAGRRGLEIELGPEDLQRLTSGSFAEICQADPGRAPPVSA